MREIIINNILSVFVGFFIAILVFIFKNFFKEKWEKEKFLITLEYRVWKNITTLEMIENSIKQFYKNVEKIINAKTLTVGFPEYFLIKSIDKKVPVFLLNNWSKKTKYFKELLFQNDLDIEQFNKSLKEMYDMVLFTRNSYLDKKISRSEMKSVLVSEVSYIEKTLMKSIEILKYNFVELYKIVLEKKGKKVSKEDILKKIDSLKIVGEDDIK